MIAILLILFLSVVVALYLITDPTRKYDGKYLHGPKGLPFLGLALDFMSSDPRVTLRNLIKICKEWNGRARFYLGHHKMILVSDPKDIEQIMTDQRFLKKSDDYNILRPWLQDGLLTVSDKSKWHVRRKTLTPAFHFKILDEFLEVMNAQAHVLLDVLKKEATGTAFDIKPYITLYTLDVICETSMGFTVNAQVDKESEYVKSVGEISGIIFWRMHHFLGRDDWFFALTPKRVRHDLLKGKIHKFTETVIEGRRKQKVGSDDHNQNHVDEFGIKKRRALLDILLESTINDVPLTTKEIQEEVDNFMFAGHDTTTSTINFLLYNIAKYSEIQDRVYNEIVEVTGRDTAVPLTLSKLNDLSYLDLVMKESLRMFPSVPLIGRTTSEDIEINGTIYPAHHNILIGIYMLHTNPDIYPEPFKFKPERFLEQKEHEKTNAFSYIPFSGGYRNCIGQKFAQYEIKTVVTRILQKYTLKLGRDDFEPELGVEIILRPMNGILLKLQERVIE